MLATWCCWCSLQRAGVRAARRHSFDRGTHVCVYGCSQPRCMPCMHAAATQGRRASALACLLACGCLTGLAPWVGLSWLQVTQRRSLGASSASWIRTGLPASASRSFPHGECAHTRLGTVCSPGGSTLCRTGGLRHVSSPAFPFPFQPSPLPAEPPWPNLLPARCCSTVLPAWVHSPPLPPFAGCGRLAHACIFHIWQCCTALTLAWAPGCRQVHPPLCGIHVGPTSPIAGRGPRRNRGVHVAVAVLHGARGGSTLPATMTKRTQSSQTQNCHAMSCMDLLKLPCPAAMENKRVPLLRACFRYL